MSRPEAQAPSRIAPPSGREPATLTLPDLVGTSVTRTDAMDKVRGRAQFVQDVSLPRMLYGAVTRSPHPHARILSVDTSRARRLPGVKAVITSADTARHKWGAFRPDLYPLAVERVRYVGDEVAAVAAVDLDTAREAASLVEVEYEELPGIFSLDDAVAAGAPLVHDDAPGNLAHNFSFERGDVDGWFARSDVIIEGTWETRRQWHAAMETLGCTAEWTPDGRVTLWVNTQTPFLARQRYATALGVPERDVRVVQTEVGGGFGGKSGDDNTSVVCALLSRASGRPVQLVLSREEEFLTSRPRIPMRFAVKLGFTRDGMVTAKDLVVLADNGAYTGKSQAVLGAATVRHDALYRYRAVRADSSLVYTNLVPTGAFRGFGNPSADWAVEQAWDMAARELGIDPVDLLLRNAVEPGDVSPHNHRIDGCELKQCIEKAADLIGWREKRAARRPNRGLAIACSVHVSGRRSFGDYDGSSAIVRVNEDGRATIIVGEGEIGTGARTTLAQIAAARLGLPHKDITVSQADTDLTTHALGALASRVTYVAGNAVLQAAGAAREQLLEAASTVLSTPVDGLDIVEGYLVGDDGSRLATVGSVVREALYRPNGEPIVGLGSFDNPSEFPDQLRYGNESGAYNFIAEAAEVEVDPATGQVTVLEIAAVTDCGTVLNRALAEGQVEGAIAQGLGLAMTEYFDWSGGRPVGANFADYKLPTAGVMPKLHVDFADSYEPTGPYGAKGVGEIALDPVPAIVANAVADAVGVRIHELPITAEKVYRALHPDVGDESGTPVVPEMVSYAARPTHGHTVRRPADLDEALRLLAEPDARPVAGGVGLTLGQRFGDHATARMLVAVGALPELRGVRETADGLWVGAGESLETLARHELLDARVAVLAKAVRSVATERIRRLVTLGGNVAPGDPAHDPPVALVALGARSVVAGAAGRRTVPFADLVLADDELLLGFELDAPSPRTGSAYAKHLVRGVWEYACVSTAAVVRLGADGGLADVSLALGSAAATTVAVPVDGISLERPVDEVVDALASAAEAASAPVGDVRGSVAYKRRMVAEFTRRAVRAAMDRVGNEATRG